MIQSASIGELAKALVKAQLNVGTAIKAATNPHFKSKYADLTAVSEACMDALNGEGIAVIQGAESTDGVTITVTTMLVHTSGEWVSASLGLKPSKSDPQGAGSAITYGRRYGLAAIVGVTTADDDGNEASAPPPPRRETPRPQANAEPQTPLEVFMATAAKWTGLASDPVAFRDARAQIAKAAGVSVNGKPPSDQDLIRLTDWMNERAEQGIDFTQAIGGKP
jgi:hypothetical protein